MDVEHTFAAGATQKSKLHPMAVSIHKKNKLQRTG